MTTMNDGQMYLNMIKEGLTWYEITHRLKRKNGHMFILFRQSGLFVSDHAVETKILLPDMSP
jgi:hypothetical protein